MICSDLATFLFVKYLTAPWDTKLMFQRSQKKHSSVKEISKTMVFALYFYLFSTPSLLSFLLMFLSLALKCYNKTCLFFFPSYWQICVSYSVTTFNWWLNDNASFLFSIKLPKIRHFDYILTSLNWKIIDLTK